MKLLKCADWKVDCKTRNQTVEANPDIAGIGVIVGFLTTTCVAFLIAFTVLFLDRYDGIVKHFRKLFGLNPTTKQETHVQYSQDNYWRSPNFWSKVLSKNLLALSDTQLLTGLAVQFAALLKHCEMSIYHFQIVTELAFLTTVTHLLTVVALRNYFVNNRWINLPRIFFMLGNLALLGYTSFISYSYDLAGLDLSSSLACFYQGERPAFTTAFGGKWAALLVGAIGGHVAVILAMYFLKDEEKEQNDGQSVSQHPEGRKRWRWLKWIGAIFRTWIVAPIYAIYGVYMAGQGLKNTQALGNATVSINGSEKTWGFGQFLPVLLLALPIFAGWESFWEEKDPEKEHRFGRSRATSQAGSRSMLNMVEMQSKRVSDQRSRDGSVEERRIESRGPSPAGTPRPRSTSRVGGSSQWSSPLPSPGSFPPMPSPHLSVPSPAASPGLGIQNQSPRGRSPSRFEERFSR